MNEYVLEQLAQIVGTENILTSKEDLIPYSFDGTAVLNQYPGCVVFPSSREQIGRLLGFAHTEKIPVVTRGSGTGLSGGSVPSAECIILCTVKLNHILELDTKNLTMLVEPGVITLKIAEEAEKAGLFYPPDPGSMKISTIGGNVAENSGGLRGLKYGVTRDYVMGLEVALPTGEIIWMGNKCVKDVAGYSLKDIFIGSEGTLGVITKVLLKLIPKPQTKKTMLAVFGRMDQAAQTVSAIIENKIIPCTLEFLDNITIKCVEDYAKIGLPTDAEAILLIETDGHPAAVEEEALKMTHIAESHGAREVILAKDNVQANQLAAARRSAFSALARLRPTTILEDATVPRSELAKMVNFIQDIAKRYDLRIGTFGHMGDGNLHPTFLTDEKNHEEMERIEKAMVEIFDYAVKLGGTITGEHGVGLAKKAFLTDAVGELNVRVMRHLKKAFDPHNILNPGKIFD